MQRKTGFEAIRLICAVLILFENMPFSELTPKPIVVLIAADLILLLGKVGVEVLLVLSGYFYTRSLLAVPVDQVRSLVFSRLCRLLPLMWVVLALGSLKFENAPWFTVLTTFYNYSSSVPDYYDQYLPFWTLCVIAQFAVVWSLPFAIGVTKKNLVRLAIGWIVCGFLIGTLLDIVDQDQFMSLNYKSVLTRGTGLCIGAIFALLPLYRKNLKQVGVVGLFAWILAVCCYNANVVYGLDVPFTFAQTLVSVAALCVVHLAWDWQPQYGKAISKVAGYSFALYVVEYPVMAYFLGENGEKWGLESALETVGYLVAASVLIVILVERPISRIYKTKSLH